MLLLTTTTINTTTTTTKNTIINTVSTTTNTTVNNYNNVLIKIVEHNNDHLRVIKHGISEKTILATPHLWRCIAYDYFDLWRKTLMRTIKLSLFQEYFP